MKTLTLSPPGQLLDFSSGAVTGLSSETLAPHLESRHAPSFLENIGKWVLAVTAATAPVVFYDVRHELLRSSSSSLIWPSPKRRGRIISFKEAWDQAGRVLLEAEARRAAHREVEARQWLWLTGEDNA